MLNLLRYCNCPSLQCFTSPVHVCTLVSVSLTPQSNHSGLIECRAQLSSCVYHVYQLKIIGVDTYFTKKYTLIESFK